jgi:hypothetical protein
VAGQPVETSDPMEYAKPAPKKTPSSDGHNLLTYLLVGVTGLGILGFAYLLFGQQFVLALVMCVLIGGVGCIHYLLWGRSLTVQGEQEKLERASETPRTE